MVRATTSEQGTQIDLAAWAKELDEERDRLDEANERRAGRRGYLVFATDPSSAPDDPDYREVFATEAKTPGEAMAKVRPLAEGRRLRTFLAPGTYKEELADARWVAQAPDLGTDDLYDRGGRCEGLRRLADASRRSLGLTGPRSQDLAAELPVTLTPNP